MKRLPNGPSPEQVARDRNCTAISTLTRMLARKRELLRAVRWPAGNKEERRWSEAEMGAAEHQCRCEIEALETALIALQNLEDGTGVLLDEIFSHYLSSSGNT